MGKALKLPLPPPLWTSHLIYVGRYFCLPEKFTCFAAEPNGSLFLFLRIPTKSNKRRKRSRFSFYLGAGEIPPFSSSVFMQQRKPLQCRHLIFLFSTCGECWVGQILFFFFMRVRREKCPPLSSFLFSFSPRWHYCPVKARQKICLFFSALTRASRIKRERRARSFLLLF